MRIKFIKAFPYKSFIEDYGWCNASFRPPIDEGAPNYNDFIFDEDIAKFFIERHYAEEILSPKKYKYCPCCYQQYEVKDEN